MNKPQPGDRIEVINNNNGDSKIGAVGEVLNASGYDVYCKFTDKNGWWVRKGTYKFVGSKLFPKKLTSTQAT